MTTPTDALTEEQRARVTALDVAHGLLSGRSSGSVLTSSGRDGLLPDELPHAVALAEYVLTGLYIEAEVDEAEELDTLATAGGSSSLEEAPTDSRAAGYIDTTDPAVVGYL